jgi:hypothetical protein
MLHGRPLQFPWKLYNIKQSCSHYENALFFSKLENHIYFVQHDMNLWADLHGHVGLGGIEFISNIKSLPKWFISTRIFEVCGLYNNAVSTLITTGNAMTQVGVLVSLCTMIVK